MTMIVCHISRLVTDPLELPNYLDYTVTMWHFDADSSIEYKGAIFHAIWEAAQNPFIVVYSKQWRDGRCGIQKERQEYPNKSPAEAFNEKLNSNKDNSESSEAIYKMIQVTTKDTV